MESTFVQPTSTVTTVLEAQSTLATIQPVMSSTGVEPSNTITTVKPTDSVTTVSERV